MSSWKLFSPSPGAVYIPLMFLPRSIHPGRRDGRAEGRGTEDVKLISERGSQTYYSGRATSRAHHIHCCKVQNIPPCFRGQHLFLEIMISPVGGERGITIKNVAGIKFGQEQSQRPSLLLYGRAGNCGGGKNDLHEREMTEAARRRYHLFPLERERGLPAPKTHYWRFQLNVQLTD